MIHEEDTAHSELRFAREIPIDVLEQILPQIVAASEADFGLIKVIDATTVTGGRTHGRGVYDAHGLAAAVPSSENLELYRNIGLDGSFIDSHEPVGIYVARLVPVRGLFPHERAYGALHAVESNQPWLDAIAVRHEPQDTGWIEVMQAAVRAVDAYLNSE